MIYNLYRSLSKWSMTIKFTRTFFSYGPGSTGRTLKVSRVVTFGRAYPRGVSLFQSTVLTWTRSSLRGKKIYDQIEGRKGSSYESTKDILNLNRVTSIARIDENEDCCDLISFCRRWWVKNSSQIKSILYFFIMQTFDWFESFPIIKLFCHVL